VNYVLLDTCVLANCALLNAVDVGPELLVTISNRMRERGLRLLLPAVVELEYSRKVPEELALLNQQTRRFRKAITTEVLAAPDVSALHQTLDQLDSARASAAARAQEHFSQLADDDSLTLRVPLSGDIISEATTYVLAGRKPAKNAVRGLLDPDCLIVASIACFARSQSLSPEDTIIICSDNHADFGIWRKDAERHVVVPDIAAVIPCSVRYYSSPRTLVEEELQLDVQTEGPLAQAVEEYEGLTKTMASITAASTRDDYFSALRGQHAELLRIMRPSIGDAFKNLGLPSAELLRSMRPSIGDTFKNLGLPSAEPLRSMRPSIGDRFRNLGLPNADRLKKPRAEQCVGKSEVEDSEAADAPLDKTAGDTDGDNSEAEE
jgi:hypothetical protein